MGFGELTDEELVARHREGSGQQRTAVANELFQRHYERVAQWSYRFTGDRDTAADLAQDVFLKAHRHLDGFRGTARFTTWLYAIVRSESLNRRQKIMPTADGEDVLEELPSLDLGPDELAHRSDRADRVRRFLAQTLDELERRVFTLHYGDEMPLDAITRLLRLTNTSGAKAYIVSARRKLARASSRLRARGEQI